MTKMDTGHIYEGDFQSYKPHGIGKYKYSDKMWYEGSFVYGMKDGEGHFYEENGFKYKGEFKGDQMTGKGMGFFPD